MIFSLFVPFLCVCVRARVIRVAAVRINARVAVDHGEPNSVLLLRVASRSERIAVSLRCRARLFTHKRFLARVCACLAHAIIAERTFVVAIETKKFKLKSAAATRDTLKAVIKEKFAVSGKFSLAYVTDAGSNVPLPSLAADWPAGTVKLAVVAAESPALPLSSSGKHGA